MKNVLVTGAAGFIGSHLVEECLSLGWNVDGLDLSSAWGRVPFEGHTRIKCDIRNPHVDQRPYDIVFHLAAEPYIPASYTSPRLFVETNIVGTLNTLEAAHRSNASRVVVISTSEVYGVVSPGTKLTEDQPLNPVSTYAVTKLVADRLSYTRFKEWNTPVVILRPFNAYGPRATQTYIIPEIISQATQSNKIRLGNTDAVRDFSYVTDTAWAIAHIGQHGVLGEAYHYGSETCFPIADLVPAIEEALGRPKHSLFFVKDSERLRPVDVTWLLACNQKFNQLVPSCHHSKVPLTDGLIRTVEWYRRNKCKWLYE